MNTIIKICGIKNLKSALKAVEHGTDALGFVFAPSPRRVTPDEAKEIIRNLPREVWKAGVFVNEAAEVVSQIASYCGLDVLQLHGGECPEYCRKFALPVIKAFPLHDEEGLKAMQPYRENYQGKATVKAFLVDAYVQGKAGGTGKTCNWELARKAKTYGPIFLAGGLTPENVVEALEQVRPSGVDVSSGVETNGEKDMEKIAAFIEEVRRWESG